MGRTDSFVSVSGGGGYVKIPLPDRFESFGHRAQKRTETLELGSYVLTYTMTWQI